VLRRLCASVCEDVAECPQAADMLVYLRQHNLFIEPLDDVGEWYRLHPLLAEALLAQLRKTEPELLPILHRRARDWHAAQRHIHEAMRHALAGGEVAWAAEMVEREYRHLLAIGEMTTLRHWLQALPEATIQARPKTHLAYAWGLGYSGHYGELEQHLQQAEAALTEGETALKGEILALRAITGALRGVAPHTTQALAQQALTLVDENDALPYAMAHQALGHAYRMLGKPVLAEAEYNLALAAGPTSSKLTMLGALLRVGQVRVMRGHLRAGAESFRQHLAFASAAGGQVRFYAGEALIRLGDLYREWNELDLALTHVQEGLELAQPVENALAFMTGHFTLAHVHAARGDHLAAQATLQQVERQAGYYDFQGLAERLALHRACLALAAGRMEEAQRWAEAYASQRSPASETITDFQDLVLGYTWLRSGRLREAQSLLEGLNQAALATGRGWTVLQASTLLALAARARGDTRQARLILGEVLACAAPEGYIRLFVDEGQMMLDLLTEQAPALMHETEEVQAYLQRLLAAFGAPAIPADARPSGVNPLVEHLSAREQEVLRLMAEGASNQAIAGTLVISVGTVKSHINRILGKLGVHNRTEAVVQAQKLQLL
jgi:LuxR family maltose regulon positive regulatory protein